MNLEEKIQQALEHQRKGELRAAEAIYREVLHEAPDDAGVLHLLGLVHYQSGNHPEAVRYITEAIAINPGEALFYFNLGKTLTDLGDMEAAATQYRQAISLQANYAEAHKTWATCSNRKTGLPRPSTTTARHLW